MNDKKEFLFENIDGRQLSVKAKNIDDARKNLLDVLEWEYISELKTLTIDLDELKKQIHALCNSNIATDEKEGLHNLLGSIYDEILENDFTTIRVVNER